MFIDGIQRITGLRIYMGNQINTLYDKITLRKFSIIETINDKLKTFVRLNTPGTGALPTVLSNRVPVTAQLSFFNPLLISISG
ncbi:MAG: hypothetical protein IH595_07405 [Bacteroidales bacterium]|nr:hypothetical protein [Bacteroidales bacterium]